MEGGAGTTDIKAECKKSARRLWLRIKEPWIRTVIYIALTLLVPEYIALAFSLLAFGAALREAKKSGNGIRAGSMENPMLAILIIMGLGIFLAQNRFSTFYTILLWISACFIYIAFTTVITSRRRLEMAIFVITVAVSMNGIIAALQFFLSSLLKLDINMALWKSFDSWFLGFFRTSLVYTNGDRTASTFCNPNVFAESMAMLLPFGLYFACSHRKDARHNLCRVLVPLAIYGTLFSFSRGAYLALIIVVLMYALFHIKKLKYVLIALVIVILLIPSSVYARFLSIDAVKEFLHGVMTDFSNQNASFEGSLLDSLMNFFESAVSKGGVEESSRLRFDAWISTLRLIGQRPILGYGAGYINIRGVIMEAGILIFHTHNFILQTLMEGGVLLLGSYFWLMISVFKKGFLLIRRSSAPKLGLSVECFIIAFAVTGLTDLPLITVKLMYSFAIALGLTEAASGLYYERRPLTPKEAFIFRKRKKNTGDF